tara:strand:- start:602 stop:880 length:279 start_codon:yes stop_codon:yes gene_type:complete
MPGILTALKKIFTKGSKAVKNRGPVPGSLDESFQKFVKEKGLLNKKGFFEGGYRGGKTGSSFSKEIKKNNPKAEQLKLDLKRGGAIGPNGVL